MTRLSVFVLSVFLASVVAKFDTSKLSEDTLEMIENLHDTCINTVDVDPALVEKAIDGDISDDEKLKCYSKCLFVESGVMEEDGKIVSEHLVSFIPDELKEKSQQIIEECAAKFDDDDLCEKAHNVIKCSKEQDEENFLYI